MKTLLYATAAAIALMPAAWAQETDINTEMDSDTGSDAQIVAPEADSTADSGMAVEGDVETEADVATDTDAMAPAEEGDVASDSDAMTEDTETEMATDMDASAPAAGVAVVAMNGAEVEIGAEDLIGEDVLSTADDEVGEVSDIVFTSAGQVEAAIIDVGGFLGFGEHTVAVPIDQLRFEQDGDDGDDWIVRVDMSEEQLEAMPEYNPEELGE